MIQKQTWLNLTDSSMILWIKAFQLYGGFYRHYTTSGFYLKGSVRIIRPQFQFYKGFNIKKIKKRAVRRILVVRDVYTSFHLYPKFLKFKKNSGTLIKKKNLFTAKHILGPTSRKILNKRLLLLFSAII